MELISLDTLIKVYKVYGNDVAYLIDFANDRVTGEIKELVDYCDNVKSYLHSVHSTDLEFYKSMLEHDNFLDRMVTLLYMIDKVYYEFVTNGNLNTPDFTKFKNILKDSADFKLVRRIKLELNPFMVAANKESLEQAYYEVFKKEILAKKREYVLNQIL
jgi:hypothetical protein